MKKIVLLSGILLLLIYSHVFAYPVVFYPSNGHSYQAISGQYDWSVAKILAENAGGYLATLTSQLENDWVWSNVISGGNPSWYLLGGSQLPSSQEPAAGWQWVTAESWSFTKWNTNEPNNNFGGYPPEDALQFWNNGKWNDLSQNSNNPVYGGPVVYQGYIVEFNPIPEPATMSLLGLGLLGLVGFKRRGRE